MIHRSATSWQARIGHSVARLADRRSRKESSATCLATPGTCSDFEIDACRFGQFGQFPDATSVSLRVLAVGRRAASRQELRLVLVAVSPRRAETAGLG